MIYDYENEKIGWNYANYNELLEQLSGKLLSIFRGSIQYNLMFSGIQPHIE